MTLEALDEEIALCKERVVDVGQRLVELDAMPTYQAIRAGQTNEGRTRAQVGSIRHEIDRMWTLYGEVGDVLTKVQEIRARPPVRWKRDEWGQEMAAILHGRVDEAPLSPSPVGNLADAGSKPTLSLEAALREVEDAISQGRL
jgi:hypothetical protein